MDSRLDSQGYGYDYVVETLSNLFGNVLSTDIIAAVVESCEGDLNVAAEAIVNISNDALNVQPMSQMDYVEQTPHSMEPVEETSTVSTIDQMQSSTAPNIDNSSVMSYASMFRSTGAVPKQQQPPKTTKPASKQVYWTEQCKRIVDYHNKGYRVLILMRGVPGSGKSHLAKQFIQKTIGTSFVNYKTHICSTDDYFMVGGNYIYNRQRLSEAHEWNQNRVRAALQQGLSPIIVDNTNIEIWEMEPYLRYGVQNGYIIEVVEPNTPWARKLNHLIRRNSHNVPVHTIKRMLENFVLGITGDYLIKSYGLSYPADMVPPIMRTIPAYSLPQIETATNLNESSNVSGYLCNENTIDSQQNIARHVTENTNIENPTDHQDCIIGNPFIDSTDQHITFTGNPFVVTSDKNQHTNVNENSTEADPTHSAVAENLIARLEKASVCSPAVDKTDTNDSDEEAKYKKYLEIQKQLDEMQKFEQEWDNGEAWDESKDTTQSSIKSNENTVSSGPKPPRRHTNSEGSTPRDTTIESVVKKCDDWRHISLFMPPWNDALSIQQNQECDKFIEKTSTGTNIEIGDMNDLAQNNLKIITATPRDINLFYMPLSAEKIPAVRNLDKSTMTAREDVLTEPFRCKNEEKHFNAFRRLFKNISKAALRDIFDKCCGDVNWAVDIVLGGVAEHQLQTLDTEDVSDAEDETGEQCGCVSSYNIIPDVTAASNTELNVTQNVPETLPSNVALPSKKAKVSSASSESVHIKRQIEQNVVISDIHYSEHCLKIRKMRRGEFDTPTNIVEQNVPSQAAERSENMDPENETVLSSSIKEVTMYPDNQESLSKREIMACESEDEESNASSIEDVEKTVNINLGREFITQLDNLFGRSGMTYPESVVPKINIPLSLLNEINAFWMESLMHQLDEFDKNNAKMIKEDAELARQLALKEAELAQQGKEPEVPDFKEIMDMDFALSLYHKDVAEWRNKEPNDLAAKLSREKLYNLFPEMSKEILSEMLMAHDNNFQDTVEVLLMSTGKANILEEKNGLNKFIVQKEMERQEKLLQEEKKVLSEVEWPLLPQSKTVAMATVDQYREEANKHLNIRNVNFQKAQDYIRRGMTQVANYYNDVANFHKQKYEQANSMAAASLMQIHAANCQDNATIDLHYLRVAEAKESLDLFLDTHIQKLKESSNKAERVHTLFFITGRGLHSRGGPRVKPAVKKRLRERGLVFAERNPGLLTARVCAEDKLTHQVAVP